MMLHCTLVPAPGSALPSGPLELAIEMPAACPGAELQAAISRRYGTGELTVDRVPVAAFTVGEGPSRRRRRPGGRRRSGGRRRASRHPGCGSPCTRRAQRAGRRPGRPAAARTVPDRTQRHRNRRSGCRVVPRTCAAGRLRLRRHRCSISEVPTGSASTENECMRRPSRPTP